MNHMTCMHVSPCESGVGFCLVSFGFVWFGFGLVLGSYTLTSRRPEVFDCWSPTSPLGKILFHQNVPSSLGEYVYFRYQLMANVIDTMVPVDTGRDYKGHGQSCFLPFLEKLVERNNKMKGFSVGSTLSLADLKIFYLMDMTYARRYSTLLPLEFFNFAETYPNLISIYKNVRQLPGVVRYLDEGHPYKRGFYPLPPTPYPSSGLGKSTPLGPLLGYNVNPVPDAVPFEPKVMSDLYTKRKADIDQYLEQSDRWEKELQAIFDQVGPDVVQKHFHTWYAEERERQTNYRPLYHPIEPPGRCEGGRGGHHVLEEDGDVM